eukprot:TRINITY_DN15391_c0_g1_i1.p2 TRINITY_DN15391_c0_g1~~TRINITY_DN15391_c0_g1_i1.p2  ORF type:complete len:106 (+),score=11.55 TRINITY_DN15391_c0_g1_i1:82-399(+)
MYSKALLRCGKVGGGETICPREVGLPLFGCKLQYWRRNVENSRWVFSHTLEGRKAQFSTLAFTTTRHLHMVLNPIFTFPIPKHHLRVTKYMADATPKDQLTFHKA